MPSIFIYAPLAAFVLVGAVVFLLMPGLTRRDIWFAVTVDPTLRESAEGRVIVRRYRVVVLAGATLSAGVVAAAWVLRIPLLAPVATLLQMTVALFAFLRARQRVLPHAVAPTTVREANLRREAATVPMWLHAGPLLILAGSVAWLLFRWDNLPARIPLHWNAQGQVDRWGHRTVPALFGPALDGVCLCAFLWLLGWLIGRTRRVNASGAAAIGEQKFRLAFSGMLVGAEYLVATIFGLIAIPTGGGPLWPVLMTPGLTLVYVLVMMVVLVHVGQGGSRLLPNAGGSTVGDRTPDACWKWGVFYVNRDDPAFFVEKRFGLGYTLNFGHRSAVPLMLLPLLVPLVLILVIRLSAH